MKTLAALKALRAYCANMVSLKADPDGGFAKAGEICKQLCSLGEDGLGRLLQLMNYVRELTKINDLPSEIEFRKLLDAAFAASMVIDCDADPYVPEDWTLVEHIKGGMIESDSPKIFPGTSPSQKIKHGPVLGRTILREFRDKPTCLILNANVLDFWLKHPELIPKVVYRALQSGYKIAFWGTIYHDAAGRAVVRHLFICRDTRQLFHGWKEIDTPCELDYLAAVIEREVKP